MVQAQVVKHLGLQITKAIFPFAFEILAHRAAQAALDGMIRINKRQAQPPSQLTPNGRFA
jgi:hypothetical protein